MESKELQGKGVFGGISFGKLKILKRQEQNVVRKTIENIDDELKRFEKAKKTALKELGELYEKSLKEIGEANAMIFQIHQMMVEDLDYTESICSIIKDQKANAEYAVLTTGENFLEMFSKMDDEYMKERAADVKDISKRLLNILTSGSYNGENSFTEPVIVAADDLAPSETVQLDKKMVLGFVTRKGSQSSHTAILARTMNIPAIIGVGDSLKDEFDGQEAIIDGFSGQVFINPNNSEVERLTLKKQEKDKQTALLQELKGKENITLDGQKVELFANIGNAEDVGSVLQNDGGGIGLFRSEFVYLECNDYPSEEYQFAIYKDVAQKMASKKVVIRTMDIGADKQVEYFNMEKEANPALGLRALRICLRRHDIFETQLKALFRASAFGKLAIMFPMVTSVEEVKQIKDIVAKVKAELDESGIAYDKNMELGVMIETPAAAVISDKLAKEVDFFSIGTNDLIQYTEAVDRQNPNLGDFFNPHHTAILRLIAKVTENAHKAGIWTGICGELGADPELTEFFLSIGIDELSVSPSSILSLRKIIRECDVSKIKNEKLKLLK